jgi:tRNA pseudouridine38-40 synthase
MRYFIKLAYNGSLYHGLVPTERLVSSRNDEQAISTLLNSEISIMEPEGQIPVFTQNVCPF